MKREFNCTSSWIWLLGKPSIDGVSRLTAGGKSLNGKHPVSVIVWAKRGGGGGGGEMVQLTALVVILPRNKHAHCICRSVFFRAGGYHHDLRREAEKLASDGPQAHTRVAG